MKEPGSGRLDALADAADLVRGQVVEDDDVAGPEFGLFGPGMWCDGSSLNRSGCFVQAWQTNA